MAMKEEILAAVAAMSVIELMDLVKAMEIKFGVSAASLAAPQVIEAAAEEKVEFSAQVMAVGQNRMAVILALRELTGWGLKDAKNAVDAGVFFVAQNVSRDDAQKAIDKLQAAGASCQLV